MQWVMGLLLVIGGPCVLWGILTGIRDAIHASRAARDLPVVARELGLRIRPTRRLPELHGKIDGFVIAVRDAEIEIELRESTPLTAAHMTSPLPPPHSWIFDAIVRAFQGGAPIPEFAFGDPVLDRYFPERRVAMRSDGDSVAANPALQAALRRLIERHGRFASLRLGDTISCAPMIGHSGTSSSQAISGAQVRALLPDLLDVARALEPGAIRQRSREPS